MKARQHIKNLYLQSRGVVLRARPITGGADPALLVPI